MDRQLLLLLACLILLYFLKDIIIVLIVLSILSYILHYAIDEKTYESTFGSINL